MQVTETLSDGLKRAYTVVVPAADIEGKRTAKLSELGRTLRIPGFRPGKVPMPVVRQRFGTAVLAEVLEESVNEATQQVLTDRGLRPAMRPKVDLVGEPDPARDLEFKVELELLPEIALPDFAGFSLTRLKGTPPAELIDRTVGELAGRQAVLTDVTEDRGAETGDVVTVDYAGSIDGTPFPGGTGTGMAVEIGGSGFIPGFAEQIAGIRPGEQRSITATFPEGYAAPDLAGKTAVFEVTAKRLQHKEVPAIDDALAEKLGFDTLDELRQAITQQMQRQYDQLSRLKLKRALLDQLANGAAFTAPDGLVDAEFEQIWQRVEADRKNGQADDDDRDKDDATLRAEYRTIAERRVKLGLLLSEIGRTNGITVGNDEMTRAMRAEASRYPGQENQVLEFFRKNPQAADGLRGPIFEDKVVDFVLELAKVEERAATEEELRAEDPVPSAASGEAASAESGGSADPAV